MPRTDEEVTPLAHASVVEPATPKVNADSQEVTRYAHQRLVDD
jgi:hypothetical protein